MTGYRSTISLSRALGIVLTALAFGISLSSCERRELFVYGNEFHSVILDVDWRQYVKTDPDGMTVWFYPLSQPEHAPYRSTTAEVRHYGLYLPGGRYQGVVIDYSPEEFSNQEFLEMDGLQTARVVVKPAAYQPDVPLDVLYGEDAWTPLHVNRPPRLPETGIYTVASQPESIGADTLMDKTITVGDFDDYIPWKLRDEYQQTIEVKHIEAEPLSLVWTLRVRIYIKGIDYLWNTQASITGLADGHYLPLNENTDTPCLIDMDNWEVRVTGENEGYIATNIYTFGLRPKSILNNPTRSTFPHDADGDGFVDALPEEIRLNLLFTLRDHSTKLFYHFNVGHRVEEYEDQMVLRIDLDKDYFRNPDDPGSEGEDPIILPYVDAYNGAGFDAVVTPWEEVDQADITF